MNKQSKFYSWTAILLISFLGSCSSTGTSQKKVSNPAPDTVAQTLKIPQHFQDIKYPEFHYQAPNPEEYRVPITDSIIAYLVPDRRLPWIQMGIYFEETTLPAKPEQSAAVALLGPMLRRGGSQSLSPEVLDDSLELLAASIHGDFGSFHSSMSLQCLSRDFPKVFAMMEDLFSSPRFDQERLEIQKASYLQNIAHKYDQPQNVLDYLNHYTMYQSNPRMWNARPEEVKAISSETLRQMAQGRFQPRHVVLSLSGDFDRDSMVVTLRNFFGRWQGRKQEERNSLDSSLLNTPAPLQFKNLPGIYLVDKKTTQANILLEQPFVRRPHPDYYAAALASYILGGGGFTSRLTERVRSNEGLAYSIYSYAKSDYDEIATTGIALQTKVSSAAYALKLIREEILKLAQEGPSDQELESAKQSLLESFPGLFDSPQAMASIFARSEIWGRNLNHFRVYPEKIRAITAADIQRCIAQWFEPSKMTVSIVGPVDLLLQADSTHQTSLNQVGFGSVQIVPLDSLEIR